MMCPVCKRDLAPTLSICLTCGAMINDTVREELETKISRTSGPIARPAAPPKMMSDPAPPPPKTDHPRMEPPKSEQPKMEQPKFEQPKFEQPKFEQPKFEQPKLPIAPQKPIAQRLNTADLRVKKTSPTLVEFQTKKATVPEWRLQLQNSVRQKVGGSRREDTNLDRIQPAQPKSTSGANALKVEYVEDDQPARHQNPRVASALKRIEESRRAFTNKPIAEQSLHVGKATPPRNFPFNVVARSEEQAPQRPPHQKATVNASPKPMLVSPLKIEKRGFDTNKLPPLSKEPKISSSLEVPAAQPRKAEADRPSITEPYIEKDLPAVEIEYTDEIEDLAPLSMRFNASLFDMIIGLFASLILLSPFMLSGGTWLSLSGFFAIAAAIAIVMFLYLTISIAFVGRTFGMRLFSLELVDVDENAYPTLHQAAVSSSVYLLSLAFAGIGFLPIFFNEERRAAHDILSGTILVREY